MKKLYLFVFLTLINIGLFAKPSCSSLDKNTIPETSQQVVIVEGDKTRLPEASLTLCERKKNNWKQILPVFKAVVGKNGIAKKDAKTEGDMMTPSGIFSLGEAFGFYPVGKANLPNLKLDYRYIVDMKDINEKFVDKYIDDVSHPDYNRWVVGTTDALSFEEMRRSNNLYEFGEVINYNMNPIVKGKGSAVFIHIWRGPDKGTAGCVALNKADLLKLLMQLDKSKQPLINILP